MIQKTFGLSGVLRHALAPLLPNLRLAFIYGSIAKGSATADSDIDLLSKAVLVKTSPFMAIPNLGGVVQPRPNFLDAGSRSGGLADHLCTGRGRSAVRSHAFCACSCRKKLCRKISPAPYTTADYLKRHQEQQNFLMRVLEQAKIFLIGDDNDLRRLREPRQDS